VCFGCVLADAGYGLSAPFRQGLTARKLTWAGQLFHGISGDAIGTVLHPFDGNHDLVGGVALRGLLGGARDVAARSGAIDAAGTVMRFAPEKDPHLWLDTAAAIAAARPDTRFVLAGYGNLAKQVEHRIETLGLADRCILPGAAKDVGLIYGALDVLLLTSRFEGTPNVLIETQAAGIRVVASDVGGVNEALLDGVTGILVGNRQASSLASAVLEILGDPGWREHAATEGPAFVSKRFGHQRMTDDTIVAYGCSTTCAISQPATNRRAVADGSRSNELE
jgi:hypothetical protein